MSIIQEALKKSQAAYIKTALQKEVAKAAEEAAPVNAHISEDIPAGASRHSPVFLPVLISAVIMLTITIGLGLKSFFSNKKAGRNANHNTALKDTEPPALNQQNKTDKLPESTPVKSENTLAARLGAPQPPDLILNGIMYIREKPRAIINGNVVEVGESVGGAKVNAINEDRVLLNYNGVEITLKFPPKAEKKK
jgi:type II secretory pathway component PulC